MPTSAVATTPNVSFLGLAKEVTRGTALAPTVYIPVTSLNSPQDMPHYAPDKGLRGAPVDVYDMIATQTWAEPDYAGDAFPDALGYWALGMFGEVSTTGSSPTTSTTLNGGVAVGATTIVVASATGLVAGNNIQIDTGGISEVKTITSVSTNTLTLTQPLLFAHLTGVAVTLVTAPFIHKFNAFATPPFQAPSYTLTDYNGVTTRQLPGFLPKELHLKLSATSLVTYSVKGASFRSATTTKPTPVFSAEVVKPAYQGVTTLGGSSTTLVEDIEVTYKRNADAIPTVNGTQDPAAIWDGGNFSASGKITLLFVDETEYVKFLTNASSSLTVNVTSGAGAAQRGISFTLSKTKYTAAAPARTVGSKQWVSIPYTFDAVANTTDIGQSGGYGPGTLTLTNAVVTY